MRGSGGRLVPAVSGLLGLDFGSFGSPRPARRRCCAGSRRPRPNGLRAREEEGGLQLVDGVVRAPTAQPGSTSTLSRSPGGSGRPSRGCPWPAPWCVGALGPEHLVARAERRGLMGPVQGVSEGAVAVDLHDLYVRPGAASRWRMIGSVSFPRALASPTMWLNSFKKRRWPVVAEEHARSEGVMPPSSRC